MAGPRSGWEGSDTRGAAITLWGINIGAERGQSALSLGGMTLSADEDFAAWGENTQPKTPKRFQRITFWLRSDMELGTSTVQVTVNGVESNPLPFEIRDTGGIYFVALDGDDNNDGRHASQMAASAGPWKNFGKAVDRMKPGDFLYMGPGEWTFIHSTRDEQYKYIGYRGTPAVNGEPDSRITLTSYPGQLATFKDATLHNHSDYWTLANLSFSGGRSAGGASYAAGAQPSFCSENSDHSVGLDVVGCEFSGTVDHAIQAFGDNFRFVANLFANEPTDDTSYVLYLCSGDQRTIKDNEFAGGSMYAIHAYDEDRPNCTDQGRVMSSWNIEGNLFDASDNGQGFRSAIIAGAANVASMRDVTIRNNVFYSDGTTTAAAIRVYHGDEKGIRIQNNTFWGFKEGILVERTSAPEAGDVTVANNIFAEIAAEHVDNKNSADVVSASNNLFEKAPQMNNASDENPEVGAPGFVDAAGCNFRLDDKSAAVDRGKPLDDVTRDFDGRQRPQGYGWDIGAFERPVD